MFYLPNPPARATTLIKALTDMVEYYAVDAHGRKTGEPRIVPVMLVCQPILLYNGKLMELLGRVDGGEAGYIRVVLRPSYHHSLVLAELSEEHLVALRPILGQTYAPLDKATAEAVTDDKWEGEERRAKSPDDIRY